MRRLSVLLPALLAILVGASPALAWTWPVDGPVLQAFSLGDDPYAAGHHRGIDVGAPAGRPVAAPAAGSVSFAGTVPGGGKTVTIKTGDGYSVTLVHLGTIEAQEGASVAEGELVGTVGPSGDAEHAEPYVHLGIRVASEPEGYVDPLTLLPTREAAAPPAAPAEDPVPPQAPAEEPAPSESAADEPPPPASDGGDSAGEEPSGQPTADPVTTDASAPAVMKPVAVARRPVMAVPSRALVESPRPAVRSPGDVARRAQPASPRALGPTRPAGTVVRRPHVRIEPTAVPDVAVLRGRRANPDEISRGAGDLLLAAAILAGLTVVGGTIVSRRRRPHRAQAPRAESSLGASSVAVELAATPLCESLDRARQRSRRAQHPRRRASVAGSARRRTAVGRR